MDRNRDRSTVVRIAQAAISDGAGDGREADLRGSGDRIQHQFESSAARDTFREAQPANSQEDEHRSFNGRKRTHRASRGRSRVTQAPHGLSRALKAREYISRCLATACESEDGKATHVVQPDSRFNRAAFVERSKPSEHSNQARARS